MPCVLVHPIMEYHSLHTSVGLITLIILVSIINFTVVRAVFAIDSRGWHKHS